MKQLGLMILGCLLLAACGTTVGVGRPGSDSLARVTCDVEIAQESNVYGGTVRNPVLAGKGAYQGLLKEVKRRVKVA